MVEHHVLMIAHQCIPVLPEKLQYLQGTRPAVDHVSHRNWNLVRHLLQQSLQRDVISLNVPDQVQGNVQEERLKPSIKKDEPVPVLGFGPSIFHPIWFQSAAALSTDMGLKDGPRQPQLLQQ